jgi:nucleoside-diphosphate-sugar epimerase
VPSLVILGADGFLGRSLIAEGNFSVPVKAFARICPTEMELTPGDVTWHEANLLEPRSLDKVLDYGDIVCNLAYMPDAGEALNFAMIDNVIEACLRSRASRFVHCSTAVVAGAARTAQITETTTCVPISCYEKTKLSLEHRVLSAVPRGLDVGIIRPTAIVGPGGQNLRVLATSLLNGNWVANYLRASLFRVRPMHLVPVRNVTAALLHLVEMRIPLQGNIYQVSADYDPDNRFANVERILLQSLGLPPRKLPLIPFPAIFVPISLRLLRRSETSVCRVYDSTKLFDSGFKAVDSVANAVYEFGESVGKIKRNVVNSSARE